MSRVSTEDLLSAAAAGPSLAVGREGLDAVQAKRKACRWAERAFEKLAAEAHGWIGREVEIPDRGGQWPHWYSCAEDGTRLETAGPSEHRCPKCGRVYSGEPWDSVPLTSVHNGLSRGVLALGLYYGLTGDQDAAAKAAEILTGYAERYPHYPVRDHNLKTDTVWATKVSWGSLGESVWMIPICGGYDLIREAGVLSPAEHEVIREQLLRPAAHLILKHNLKIHNIQCWHNGAIGSAGLLLGDPDLVSFAVDGDAGIRNQIARGIHPDGFWFEGSWGYHFYGLTPLLAWAESLRNCGLDLYDAHFGRVFEAPLLAVRPDWGMPAFHDSGGAPLAQSATHYEIGLARYGDPRFARPLVRSDRSDLNALLHGVPDLPDRIPEPSESTHLPDAGFVYFRKGRGRTGSYLALDYGPHGGGHGHPDKLGFLLYGLGRVLAPDPGSVAYGIPIHQKWYKQTVSHNTMVVDRRSQAACAGHLDLLVNGPDFDLASASADEAYDGVRMSRTLLFTEDLILMVDRVDGDRALTMDWVYHNEGELRTGFSRAPMGRPPGDADGYEVIEDARAGSPPRKGVWRARWSLPKGGVRLSVLDERAATKVITGLGMGNAESGLGAPGDARVPLVIARRRGRGTVYRACLQVHRGECPALGLSSPTVGPGTRATGIVARLTEEGWTLLCRLKPGTVHWGEVEFDGEALVDHRDRGKERMLLAEGKRLRWGDRAWEMEPAGSLLVERRSRGFRAANMGKTPLRITSEGGAFDLGPGEQRAGT